jgi:diadenosine tetraphosphatase ApaH/serine/threonine PP2A family protein phosphatase
MILALLADLHANLEALTACLAHARTQGAERRVFLGDLVGYGADPVAVLDRVGEEVAHGALVVRGNHDAAVVEAGADTMNRAAEAAVDWTRARLDARHLEFLAGLPLTARLGDALFVHASAQVPAEWTYVTDARRAGQSLSATDATYVFCGHVHDPMLYYAAVPGRAVAFRPVPGVAIPVPPRRRWVAIVGSAGQPRDHNTAACYAIFDESARTLTFHRVPYDWSGAAAKIRAAGLPESLARRLELGE